MGLAAGTGFLLVTGLDRQLSQFAFLKGRRKGETLNYFRL